MLLVIDIGNTSTGFGVFKGKRLIKRWRVATGKVPLPSTLLRAGLQRRGIKGACVSSVVPRLNPILKRAIKKNLKCKMLFVTPKNAGIKIKRYNKKQIGADRLVNAVAAYRKYKKALIVVDLGTGTTFDYVNGRGEFCGGVIAPGIGIINDALSNRTAKLPKVPIKKTKRVISQNTRSCMQSGIFHGYIGLVNHIIDKIKKEAKTNPKIIATGGFAPLIAKSTKTIEKIDPHLTLEGLKIIWEKKI